MSKYMFTLSFTALFMALGSSQIVSAQDNNQLKREVQPIPYWVDTSSLRKRDNPVAGKVVGTLDYGQKILAYSSYENWVRISKPEEKQVWVNSDFLSNSRLSWASYNQSRPTRSSDVIAVRIKNPDNRKDRVFAVRLKTAETGNAIITTREATSKGNFFQNHFVSCNDQRPSGVRLIGEGHDFLGAQNDVRNLNLDIYDVKQINDKASNSIETAISGFACKAQAF